MSLPENVLKKWREQIGEDKKRILGASHSPQITITKREVERLLLQMKPESLKEDYARREAIAHMLRARSEYDPSVQEYMREHDVTKEDLEKWAEYWGEKRTDPEEVRLPPPPPPEAEPRVVELLRTLPPEFRIDKVERVGIIRPRLRVTISTRA
ncbi:MAG: hypothetical protein H3Z54_09665 [archaeon]|nr:hypothetical protein [archaeon]